MSAEQLTNSGIARAVETLKNDLQQFKKISRESQIKTTLMLEEILLQYQDRFGESAEFSMGMKKSFGKVRIEVCIRGEAYDPISVEGEDLLQQLMAEMGLIPTYKYQNGCNRILFEVPQKKMSQLLQMLISILGAIGCGFAAMLLPNSLREGLSTAIVTPIFETFMKLLTGVAVPMIFLSVINGIIGMGNIAAFKRIGVKTLLSILCSQTVALAVLTVGCIPFLTFAETSSGQSAFADLFQMILNIVPANAIDPFLTGNTMQVIFVAILVGVVMLVLAMKVDIVREFIKQLDYIVQQCMKIICAILPVFVFLSIFNIMLSNNFGVLIHSYSIPCVLLAFLAVLLAGYILTASIRLKISPAVLLRKIAPAALIGLTTASSSAAFSVNLEVCTTRLGMQKKFVHFGLPLAQIIFLPAAGALFLTAAICFSQIYEIPVSLGWIVIAFLVVNILSIAAPPIAGGGLTCFTLLFVQMGIPMEALAILIAMDMVLEMACTAVDIYCMDAQLLMTAGSLGALDRETLRTI